MKRLFVAATAAVISMPLATIATPAHAAPSDPSQVAASVSASTSAQRSAVSMAAAQAAAVNYTNKYSRQATRVGWRQKDRNATHLSKLTRAARMPLAKRATFISYTQKGTMYRWGGTTPRGFDCSGFTKYTYAKAGKNLPRTAAMQYRATKRTKHPAPGDLVFFGGARAHHVGIYVGNGRMIHSPRTGKPVQIIKIYRGASYGKVR